MGLTLEEVELDVARWDMLFDFEEHLWCMRTR